MSEFQIKTCAKENYDEMLKFLARAFSYDDPHWFSNNIPNCCPPPDMAKESDLENHIITLLDGVIIGSIGVYPVTWTVSYSDVFIPLKMAGVGQVAVDVFHRGQGIMSKMLKKAISKMESEEIDCSWLFGERMRYFNYGWEYGGSDVRFGFSEKSVLRLLDSVTAAGRKPDYTDVGKLNACYEKFPSYIMRDREKWECHISRDKYQSAFVDDDRGTAYLFCNGVNPREIVEINGDEECVKSLLKRHVVKYGLRELVISYPASALGLGKFLYNHASKFSLNTLCQFRVTTGDLLDKLEPIVLRQAEDCGADTGSVKEKLAGLSREEKKAVCDRLFGYAFMPWDMKDFQFVSPMSVWTSRLEDV